MTTTSRQAVFEARLNRAVSWALRHWLLFANSIVFLYGGLPWLAPLAHSLGYHQLGSILFAIYSRLCHQKPEQSFFVNGYQVAFCERETVMYTSLFLAGLVFALVRHRLKPISLRAGALLLLPMLLDGGTQLIDDLLPAPIFRGLNDSIGSFNFWTRVITGLLFTVAVILAIYPRLEREIAQMINPTPVTERA